MMPPVHLAALLVLGSLPAGNLTRGDERNGVVMPEQRITLSYSHAVHAGRLGLPCTFCHSQALQSEVPSDYLIPPRSLCVACHPDEGAIPETWSERHDDPSNAVALPPARLTFSHALHAGERGIECLTCHVGVLEADLATREHLPSMEACLACHEEHGGPAECTACHLSRRDGRVRTTYEHGLLKPDDHGPGFHVKHELDAERDLEYCASCHAQVDCLSCHDGSLPTRFHEGDYLALHPQDAFAGSPPCASCHRLERFCADCHRRAQVRPGDPLTPSFDGRFHPPGWNDFPPFRPEHHSYVARKNISACAACHADGSECTNCHQWFEGAAPTHGAGWASSTARRRLESANRALCLRCHSESDPADPINRP